METFFIAAVIGVGVGILSGLLGIGGGVVLVPLFRLGFAMQAIQATATSLFAIIPTSLAGVVTHVRNRTCIISLGLAAGLAGACTSPAGVQLANMSPSWLIMLVAACIIGYSAFTMLRKAICASKPVSDGSSHTVSSASRGESASDTIKLDHKQLVLGAIIGLFTGLASGYVGVGGGFIMVPLFLTLLGVDMRYASGTSLVAVTILAVPGAVSQIMLGNVQVAAGIAVAVGSIPGALIGANLVRRVPERQLRLAFGCLLLTVAVVLAVNEVVVG